MAHQSSNFYRFLYSSASKPLHQTLTISTFSTVTLNPAIPTKRKTFSHIFQACSNQKALSPGKQAHAVMIISGFSPTIFVTNCLTQLYIRCSYLDYANKVFDKMPKKDVVSWNAMIFGSAACGNMEIARSFFDAMPERDVVTWNSLISGYLQNGDYDKSIDIFLKMGKSGVMFDYTTSGVVLKVCSILENYDLGVQVHGLAIRKGIDDDTVTGSALVDMYAKCKKLDDSVRLFSEMPEKNWVSWSAIIAGCVRNDKFINGLELFKEMQRGGIGVSQSTYASVFRLSAGLSASELGAQLHAHAIKTDFGSDIIVGTATLDMYAKCGNMQDAQKTFNLLPNHSSQSYNAIIVGYARSNGGIEAMQLFQILLKSGLGFDGISLSGAFSACAVFKGKFEGLQVHGLAVKSNFMSNVCVANAVVDMYGKCGALVEACRVFDEMETHDAVSWNAIIAAHEQNRNEEGTLTLFVSMLQARMEPDEFTYGSVLKVCASRRALNYGMEIHNRIIKSGQGMDLFVGCALVDMYCKCGTMEKSEKIHDRLEHRTVVSWNAIISGFSLQEQSEDAQRYFYQMLEMGVMPDNFTYATVLDTCANLASVGLGKQIHAQIIKLELQSDMYISSTLVDMYSKCGNMQDSRLMFEKAPKRDFVTWNAMISGYAQHGFGEEAIKVFDNMKLEKVKPNQATFVSVLRACAHMGLVKEGLYYFNTMLSDYGLDPQLEHYSCLVDLLGRSGRVSNALKLIQEMPFEADATIWRTLLSNCIIRGNVQVAEKAASSILQLDPNDHTAYILLSNIYANEGMWDKVSNVRKMMKYNKIKKEPGCSWIEVKDEVHTFLVGDKAHPRCQEIYEGLGKLIDEMKWSGYEPDIESILDEAAEERELREELRTFSA